MKSKVAAAGALVCLTAGAAGAGGPPPSTEYSLEGTAALGGCSGSVFHFDGQSLDDDALILTNGHCIGSMGQYQVLVGVPTDREVVLFDADQAMTRPYTATEIVYATMHQTDMAILRLDATYQELLDAGVTSLLLSSAHPDAGADIVVASGLWEYTTECRIDGFVPTMQEARWTWSDSLRYTAECVTFGGTSGSPVISLATGEIVGVNNTGYEGGEPCTINNPCEIDDNGTITTVTDGSYGQQTYQLYSCIDAAFGIDLELPGCALPHPTGVLRVVDVSLGSDVECDDDGNLDPGETGVVRVTLWNEGPVALTDTAITVTSPSDAVELVAGATLQVGAIDGFATVTVDVPIALSAGARDLSELRFDVVATDSGSPEPEVEAESIHRVNFDDVPNSSTVDDVESNAVPWTTATVAEVDDGVGWTRVHDGDLNTVWHAADIATDGDQLLESPVLEVGDADFVVRFSHRYAFETSRDTYWDGGVIEISTDGGASWADAADYAADFGYGGAISDESGNPLAGRDAFVDASPAWPERSETVLDFGTSLANQSVQLRFRVGTDLAAGDFGWEIDDISVEGIDNLPFSSIEPLANSCDPPPDDETPPDDVAPGDGGCGCATSGSRGPAWLPLLAVLSLVLLRRRRRATIGA